MSDHPNKPIVIAADKAHPGASLIRMLVVGLILIVLGMFGVVFIACGVDWRGRRVPPSPVVVYATPSLMNVPARSSSAAVRSSSCVFITIGPCQATGSSSGRPDTSRKRMP